jgi:hypothetical protein
MKLDDVMVHGIAGGMIIDLLIRKGTRVPTVH